MESSKIASKFVVGGAFIFLGLTIAKAGTKLIIEGLEGFTNRLKSK